MQVSMLYRVNRALRAIFAGTQRDAEALYSMADAKAALSQYVAERDLIDPANPACVVGVAADSHADAQRRAQRRPLPRQEGPAGRVPQDDHAEGARYAVRGETHPLSCGAGERPRSG